MGPSLAHGEIFPLPTEAGCNFPSLSILYMPSVTLYHLWLLGDSQGVQRRLLSTQAWGGGLRAQATGEKGWRTLSIYRPTPAQAFSFRDDATASEG